MRKYNSAEVLGTLFGRFVWYVTAGGGFAFGFIIVVALFRVLF